MNQLTGCSDLGWCYMPVRTDGLEPKLTVLVWLAQLEAAIRRKVRIPEAIENAKR